MALTTNIRSFIKTLPMYNDIVRGDVDGMCDEFAPEFYDALLLEKERGNPHFKDMDLAIVATYSGTYHVWIIYHHPETGFGMIDPTAGQFLHTEKPRKRFYANAFVGNMDRLDVLAKAYGKEDWQIKYWPPTLYLWNCEEIAQTPAFENVWSKYPTKIEVRNPILGAVDDTNRRDVQGRIAARFKEAGVDWKEALLAKAHTDADRSNLKAGFKEIAQRMKGHLQR